MANILVEDDDAAHVSYFPPNAWDGGLSEFRNRFHGSSYHVAHVAGAYVSFVFNGSFVAYYSDLNTNHGPFDIYLDGKPHGNGSSYADVWVAPQLLYSTDVEPGMHTLLISNPAEMDDGDVWIGVDYFMYRPLPETPSTQSQDEQTPSTQSQDEQKAASRHGGANVPAIVVAICSALALILVALLVFIFVRRRSAQRRRDGLKPLTVQLPPDIPRPPAYAKFVEKRPAGVVRAG